MTERCGCGASLIAGLQFCVTCGARQPQLVTVGRQATPEVAWPGAPGGPISTPRAPAAAPRRGVDRRAPIAHPSLPPTPVIHPMPGYGAHGHHAPARSSAPWIVGAAAIVVAAVVGALLVLTLPAGHGTSSSPAAVAVPTTTTVTAAPETTVTTAASDSSTTGTDALGAQVASDRSDVEALSGEWVPQLSSKRIGTVADGITYDADGILSNYRSLASTYPNAKLLDSGDWSVFTGADYWVVVVARPYSTPAAANAWCSAQGLGPDDCFAKKLSHSGGPAGTTVQR